MHKWLLIASVFIITPFLTVSQSDTTQSTNNEIYPQFDSDYSYCKPDEDSNFSLIYEDELYYYYTGEKVIRGLIYQQDSNSSVTFDSRKNQACKFVLTQGFQIDHKLLDKDFMLQKAWENAPECTPENGEPYLSGIYALTITGFKISKSYIDYYDPKRIRSQMEMSRFEFYADYDEVVEVIAPTEVKCPIVLR